MLSPANTKCVRIYVCEFLLSASALLSLAFVSVECTTISAHTKAREEEEEEVGKNPQQNK